MRLLQAPIKYGEEDARNRPRFPRRRRLPLLQRPPNAERRRRQSAVIPP